MTKLEGFFALITTACLIGGTFIAIPALDYYISVWKSPCTEVYDGEQLIYRGNSYFYQTESRGTGTIFKEYQKRMIMPRQIQEIQSNAITIKTIKCEGE